ncbi:MAG: hypothetical protein AAF704_16685, partial [Cyanobacteria bacterium P01_D01_bin.123]
MAQIDQNASAIAQLFLTGTNGDDFLEGGGGSDIIAGRAGNDDIDGGFGDDSISGGADNDTIQGSQGNDAIEGGTGNDLIAVDNLSQGGDDLVTYEFDWTGQIARFSVTGEFS